MLTSGLIPRWKCTVQRHSDSVQKYRSHNCGHAPLRLERMHKANMLWVKMNMHLNKDVNYIIEMAQKATMWYLEDGNGQGSPRGLGKSPSSDHICNTVLSADESH